MNKQTQRIRFINCAMVADLFRKQYHCWIRNSVFSMCPKGRWNPFFVSFDSHFSSTLTCTQIEYPKGKWKDTRLLTGEMVYRICRSSRNTRNEVSSSSAWNRWSRIRSFVTNYLPSPLPSYHSRRTRQRRMKPVPVVVASFLHEDQLLSFLKGLEKRKQLFALPWSRDSVVPSCVASGSDGE